LKPVETETIPLAQTAGRVLADTVRSDRDSPPGDVSAADGFAFRLADFKLGKIPIAGEIRIGQKPPAMPVGAALYIVTGAPVPEGADVVVRIEDIEKSESHVALRVPLNSIRPGQAIRRKGENLKGGSEVLSAGSILHGPACAALASFGIARPKVFRKVRVGILTTGDEVLPVESKAEAWQIRNSNSWGLSGLMSGAPFVEIVLNSHVRDDAAVVADAVGNAIASCDVVILTGGVSMGEHDYVPGAIEKNGCEIVFHKLPVRPGKPILCAAGPNGQAVMGLPGNPVSVLTTATRFGGPVIRMRSGHAHTIAPVPVRLDQPDSSTINLWWWRPVEMMADGSAKLIETRGSGDMVSTGRSDGFVEFPPGKSGPGPWPFYRWEI
jgi:molybdopterin molybdotransferase